MSDTLEYRHHYLTQHTLISEDRVIHGLQTLTCALEDAPIQMCDEQLCAISALHKLFGQWTKNVPTYPRRNKAPIELPSEPTGKEKTKPTTQGVSRPTTHLPLPPTQASRVQVMKITPHSAPRVDIILSTETKDTTENDTADTDEPIDYRTRERRIMPWTNATPPPATPTQPDHETIARQMRSHINPKGLAQQVDISPQQASQRRFPSVFIHKWAMPIIDTFTG